MFVQFPPVGGASPASATSSNVNQGVRHGQPDPFTRTRSGAESSADDGTEPSAKRSRHTGSFGTPGQMGQHPASQPDGDAELRRYLTLPLHATDPWLPTQPILTSAPTTTPHPTTGQTGHPAPDERDAVLHSLLTGPIKTMYPWTPPQPIGAGAPTTTPHPTTGQTGHPAPDERDAVLHSLLTGPIKTMYSWTPPQPIGAGVPTSIPRPMPSLADVQTTARTSAPGSMGPSVPSADSGRELIDMLAQPYSNEEWAQLQSLRSSSTASIVQPASLSVPSPLSSMGLTVEDLNQRDSMDQYLQAMPMPMPTLVPVGSATVALQPPAGQNAGSVLAPTTWHPPGV